MRVICATDDKVHLTKDHFGDAKFYNVYELNASNATFVESIENTVVSNVHPDPSKAKKILNLLNATPSDILVNRAFGTNLSIIVKQITPAIIREDLIEDALSILKKNFVEYQAHILNNKNTYITINSKKEVIINEVKEK